MTARVDPGRHHVVVLGASPKASRYSNQATRLLKEEGFRVTPVHPRVTEIEGCPTARTLAQIDSSVDTLTLYVGSRRLEALSDEIVHLRPRRVIFNPGTESPEVERRLGEAGIESVHGCTLVMLRTGQFLTSQ